MYTYIYVTAVVKRHTIIAMGIPSYFLQIVKKYKNIIKNTSLLTGSIDNFYADCNGIVYDVIRNITFANKNIESYETEVIVAVCHKIQSYIDAFQPKEKIIVAFDLSLIHI
jgi:5'-3' exonuclease